MPKNQISLTLSPEDKQKAYELAKRLKLMNPKHPNEPSISELFRWLLKQEINQQRQFTGKDFLAGLDDDEKWMATGGLPLPKVIKE